MDKTDAEIKAEAIRTIQALSLREKVERAVFAFDQMEEMFKGIGGNTPTPMDALVEFARQVLHPPDNVRNGIAALEVSKFADVRALYAWLVPFITPVATPQPDPTPKPQTLYKGNPIRSIAVFGRRWFEKSTGNTLHTASITVNGVTLPEGPPERYGSGDQYINTAGHWLRDKGYIDLEGFTGGWALKHYCEARGITFAHDSTNVERKKDL